MSVATAVVTVAVGDEGGGGGGVVSTRGRNGDVISFDCHTHQVQMKINEHMTVD